MLLNAPSIISSTKNEGFAISVITELSCCFNPKCIASQVTVSPFSINPLVLPAMALSFVPAVDNICTSILLDRSKHRSIGALM